MYLLGEFANGRDGKYIDLLIVGNNIDHTYLLNLMEKTEKMIKRKIRFQLFEEKGQIELLKTIKDSEKLLLWEA